MLLENGRVLGRKIPDGGLETVLGFVDIETNLKPKPGEMGCSERFRE